MGEIEVMVQILIVDVGRCHFDSRIAQSKLLKCKWIVSDPMPEFDTGKVNRHMIPSHAENDDPVERAALEVLAI